MTPQHWQQVKQLFQSALQYPPDRRAAFLDEACASDPTLRSEVDSLISSNDQAGDSIEGMAGDAAAQMLAEARGCSFIGRNIGPYKIITEIGRGGMGDVFLAEDPRLNRRIALKLLPEEFAQKRDRLRRFQREARAVSALNHPNILTIHEVGQIDSLNFIVSEFIEGGTLRNRIRRQRLPVREALGIAIQIASALAAAHKAGIVHRDVKPENMMLREDGIVKVLDFGLAKLTQRQSTTTDTEAPTAVNLTTDPGAMMGTVNYMSPEQARGLDVDERTDIFSLGVLTYEMVTGQRPFEGETTSDVIATLLTKKPAPMASFDKQVPAELERIVVRCLEKRPESRYQSADELLEDLEHLRRDLDSGVAVKLADSDRSRPLITRRLLLLLILAVSIGSVFIYLVAFRGATAGPSRETKLTAEAVESIAVLPFVNAGSPDKDYLGDALTEGLIRNLSHIPNLKVIGHASVLRYKGQEFIPEVVSRELDVSAVLTGKVFQQGDDLTIAVEVTDARDGTQLLSKHYKRKFTDMLSVQQEVSRDILAGMRLRLTGTEQRLVGHGYTTNAEAYQLYLRGGVFLDRNDEASIKRAREYFQQAIDKDPGYALAFTGLADTYTNSSNEAEAAAAKGAVMKALEIDDLLGEVHISLAGILWHRDWDFPGAEREFMRGIELNPSYATGHHEYSHYLMTLGRPAESFSESEHYLELDPLSPAANVHMGWYYLMVRRYDQAIELEKKALAMDTNFRNAHFQLGEAYYYKGMFDEAVEEYLTAGMLSGARPPLLTSMREAYKRSGIRGFLKKWLNEEKQSEQRLVPYFPRSQLMAKLYGRLGAKEQALKWLERAVEKRDMFVDHFCTEPELDSLRSDPRFIALVRRIGLRP